MHNVKTLEAIMAARTLIEYCKDHTNSCRDCPFHSISNGGWTGCMFSYGIPEDWNIPTVKTYKEDFLEKFPDAKFGNSEICRRFIYGEELDYCGMTCEECWNEVYSESE